MTLHHHQRHDAETSLPRRFRGIMMSQNRRAAIDRAELEIALLHQKPDVLRDNELATLLAALRDLPGAPPHRLDLA